MLGLKPGATRRKLSAHINQAACDDGLPRPFEGGGGGGAATRPIIYRGRGGDGIYQLVRNCSANGTYSSKSRRPQIKRREIAVSVGGYMPSAQTSSKAYPSKFIFTRKDGRASQQETFFLWDIFIISSFPPLFYFSLRHRHSPHSRKSIFIYDLLFLLQCPALPP